MKALLKGLLVPLLLFFVLYPFPSAFALDVITVKADGTAIRTGSEAEAKKKANDEAFRGAVLDALNALMREEGITADPEAVASFMEKEVYPGPLKFILNFRVLSEGWTVKEVPLEGLPGAEVRAGETAVAPVTPPEGGATPGVMPAPPTPPAPPAPAVEAPLKLDVYNVWIEARVDAALLKDRLGRIAEVREASSFKEVSIVILDVTDYEAFRSLYSSLGRITMLKGLSYSSFYRGRIVVRARTAAKDADLAERIRREAGEGYTTLSTGEGTVVIKPVSKKPM